MLFLVEIAILCWMKFYTISLEAAWVATGLLIPIFIIFIAFAAMFYLKLVSHKSEVHIFDPSCHIRLRNAKNAYVWDVYVYCKLYAPLTN